jgi:hypothetical protein
MNDLNDKLFEVLTKLFPQCEDYELSRIRKVLLNLNDSKSYHLIKLALMTNFSRTTNEHYTQAAEEIISVFKAFATDKVELLK